MHTYSFLLYFSPIGTFDYIISSQLEEMCNFCGTKQLQSVSLAWVWGGRNVLIKCDASLKESIKRHWNAFQVQRPLKWMCNAVNPTCCTVNTSWEILVAWMWKWVPLLHACWRLAARHSIYYAFPHRICLVTVPRHFVLWLPFKQTGEWLKSLFFAILFVTASGAQITHFNSHLTKTVSVVLL